MMNLGSLDAILGIDWMELYYVDINVVVRTITISVLGDEILTYHYEEGEKEHMGYLPTKAYPGYGKKNVVLENIHVVSEFDDVFQEIPGLPPHREVEFVIELEWDTMPIARTGYGMTPTKFKELNVQLEELLQKQFIRVIHSPC